MFDLATTNKKSEKVKSVFVAFTCILLILGASGTSSGISDNLSPSQGGAKNVILMIGDGMGHEQIKLARWTEVGVQGKLAMEKLPIKLNVSTNNLDNFLTDSAASATAYATGSKTDNDRISKCNDGSNLKTITEIAQELGLKTGLVTTTRITHATPAAFGSHENSRNNVASIASQLVDSSIDAILGGGARDFDTSQQTTITYNGYNYIITNSELNSTSGKTWGLFANSHMNYESFKSPSEPTILEMTQKAIELLENANGFFLMVEGGRIDHAGHASDLINNALETINFDEAVNYAYEFAKLDGNTIVIVTADHETGGMEVLSENLSSPLPASGNNRAQNVTARTLRAGEINVSWLTSYHTSINVPFYAYGLPSAPSSNVIENTEVFTIMKDYIDPINTIAISPNCQKIVTNPVFWTTGIHVGDLVKYRITELNFDVDIGVVINNTIELVTHREGDEFEIEVLSINNTVIMLQKTLYSKLENAIYLFDPQPIFRTLIHEDYSTGWPIAQTFTYDLLRKTEVLPAQIITTNQTLLSMHFFDHIFSFSSTNTEIILSSTQWVSGGFTTFTFDSQTGVLLKFETVSSSRDQVWELIEFKSNFTSPTASSESSKTTSSSPTMSNSKSDQNNGPGFLFYSIFVSLIILRRKKGPRYNL